MFPGDPRRAIPAARATGAAACLERLFPHLDDIDALMAGDAPDDPDRVLKMLKARAPDLVDQFIEQAIVAYFSDPAVSHALTGKPTPLFPNNTVMPDIDFDLLEPVLQALGHDDD